MSLLLSPEQRELQGSVRSFFQEHFGSSYVRKRFESGESDSSFWSRLQELDLYSFFKVEGGGSFADLALVCSEAGRGVLPEPITERLFTGVFLGSRSADTSFKAVNLQTCSCSTVNAATLEITPLANENGEKRVSLTGTLKYPLGITGADNLILFARKSPRALRTFLLSLIGAGVELHGVSSLDRTQPLAEIVLNNAVAHELSSKSRLPHADVAYGILKSAELSGVATRAVEMTADYVKTREQFSVPVGAFQAVQQELADMYLRAESIRALVHFAAWSVDASPEQVPLAGRSALLRACRETAEIVESAIQLHGGIGFTWEYDLHFLLRRAQAIRALFDSDGINSAMLVVAARN